MGDVEVHYESRLIENEPLSRIKSRATANSISHILFYFILRQLDKHENVSC